MNNKEFEELSERVDAILTERQMEIQLKQQPEINVVYGNTYITWRYYDSVVEERYDKILNMLRITDVEYSMTKIPIMDGDLDFDFGICVAGEDEKRVTFIKDFIDNDYTLILE